MKTIVLDKSYLQSASKSDIAAFRNIYCFVMADVLFMELLTTDPKVRAHCFGKLPQNDDPITLIPSVSNMLQKEITTQAPCFPIINVRYKQSFRFNPRICHEDFVLSDEDTRYATEWEKETNDRIGDLIEQNIAVDGFFPILKGLHPGEAPNIIDNIKKAIASDREMIRAIYGSIRKDIYPPQHVIDEHWAFFRWLQVNLLAAVDYFHRYGTINHQNVHDFSNERFDVEYLIIGALSDGIATMDNSMIARYELLCPNGTVIRKK